VLARTQTRLLPVVNRAAEHAPIAGACCNACRTCVQTNLLGLVFAGIGSAALIVRRAFARPSQATAATSSAQPAGVVDARRTNAA
jgi:hypothetical protein